ncbi:MAG: flagellar export protein FliJ [Alteromonadaceae bacterium]|nr:flagellar export protein FliJ [Alteromonadaceae bacterium]
MANKQLVILLRFEKEKEQQRAQELQTAEQAYQDNLSRLSSIGDFRLEYMKKVQQRSLEGIDSATYGHYHAFINKLDNASGQIEIAIKQAQALAQQCKQQWLLQHQKVKAVELLLSKQQQKLALIAAKKEQKMFDEIATQQFVRRHY